MIKTKFIFSLIVIVLVVVFFTACSSNPDEKFSNRYKSFVSLLNNSELKLVKSKKYKDVSVLFNNRLNADKGLRKKYNDIKDFEEIKFHSTKMVFEFFFETIKKRIKFYKDLLTK